MQDLLLFMLVGLMIAVSIDAPTSVCYDTAAVVGLQVPFSRRLVCVCWRCRLVVTPAVERYLSLPGVNKYKLYSSVVLNKYRDWYLTLFSHGVSSLFIVFRFQFSADDGSRVPLLAAVYLSAPLSLADLLAAITFVVKRSKVGCSLTGGVSSSRRRRV